MAFEEVLVEPAEEFVASLTKAVAALGGVIFIAIIFNIINFFINRKKLNKIKTIDRKVNEILKLLEKKSKK